MPRLRRQSVWNPSILLILLLTCVLVQAHPALAQVYPGLNTIVIGGSGHVPCKDNDGVDLPPEQFLVMPGGLRRLPTAAIRNSSITVNITFALSSTAPAYNGTLVINRVFYRYWPNTVAFTPVSQSLSVAPGGTTTVTLTVGPLPDYVSPSRPLIIDYRLSDPVNPGAWGSFAAPLDVYLVHAQPQTPQVKPWLGVLDDACAWAEGQNTATGVSETITLGAYNSGKFVYPANFNAHWITGAGEFKLKSFLAAPTPRKTNCVDISDYVAICANGLGVDFEVGRYCDSTLAAFNTNNAKLIGHMSYGSVTFSNHQVAHPAGTTTVYDACAALEYDYSGNLWQKPSYNWPLTSYWQNQVGLNYFGLVQTPAPSSPTWFSGPPYTPVVVAL